jgi:hypothetical protein
MLAVSKGSMAEIGKSILRANAINCAFLPNVRAGSAYPSRFSVNTDMLAFQVSAITRGEQVLVGGHEQRRGNSRSGQ